MTRRDSLKMMGTGLGLSAAVPLIAQKDAGRITVQGVETFVVHVNARGNWILVRVRTSEGLTGLGEASHGGADAATLQFIGTFFERLKGRSVFDMEWVRTTLAQEAARGGHSAACALSGLEQAMWDIQGQALGVPTYNLFGGVLRTRIRNYANINRSSDPRTPAGFAAMAQRAVDAGFDAVKLAPWDDMPADLSDAGKVEAVTQLGIERAAAVRTVLGPGRDLLLDGHSKFDLARGLQLVDRVEFLKLFWLEEVTKVAGLPAMRKAQAGRMPAAGGEDVFGLQGYQKYMQDGCADIQMPDVKYCGGMLELKKIATLAEARGLPVSPHGPASPIGNVAAAHVCAGMPNFHILEHSFGEVPWRAELIDPPEQLDKGHMVLSAKPGLGIRLNEKTAARYKV